MMPTARVSASVYTDTRYQKIWWHRFRLLTLLGLALVCSLLLDLTAGPADLSLGQIVKHLLGIEQLSPRLQLILFDVRLPDALMALLVGAALGLSGIETQTVLNNPMASPFTLGISSFAALGASIAIVFEVSLFGIPAQYSLPLFALCSALFCGGLIMLFSHVTSGSRESIILLGMALFFLGNSLMAGIQFVASAEAVQQIVFWTIGNLTKAGWPEVSLLALCLLIIFPISLRHVWVMTLLRSGEAQAKSLGLDLAKIRLAVVARVALLTAFAVCFVGAIGFVGLIGPHLARLLLGEDHRLLVPGAALCGALLLSLASWLSKSMIDGVVIPVGILTAVIGVPVFIVLVLSQQRRF